MPSVSQRTSVIGGREDNNIDANPAYSKPIKEIEFCFIIPGKLKS